MSPKLLTTILLGLVLLLGGTAHADDPPAGTVRQTPLGPVTAADLDLLVKVRQAGLWEMPMGEEAQTRASSPRVRDVGRQLAADHRFLDDRVTALAGLLGVPLPAEPNADQRSWMAELRGRSGPDFDVAFADRLRAAHGKVFAFVAKVRTETTNDAIRRFAQVGVDIVMKHMTLLESTGLVTRAGLAEPVAAAPPGDRASTTSPGVPAVLLLCLVGVAATLGLLRLIRPRDTVA
ncbi:hypothetical protein GCM10022243_22730 [Saccharothrix violaceirubra]|uniref:Putative outer membrane protein n=1 Tax=Saccharothrix violaceirubra TaxID=413306 RepID=A0A7W7T1G6_9PSEU|nr:DUF4142 domain-containing protein [Saccharothrix violaceirubra]MBB4964791.1 putative outer membrane protein [Saccharothrix violaceirubra]